MNQKVLLCFLLLSAGLIFASAEYDENLAYMLSRIAGSSYCEPSSLLSLTCGRQCDYLLENGWEPKFSEIYPINSCTVAVSGYINKEKKTYIVAFRGTINQFQLLQEVLGGFSTAYDLQKTPVPLKANFYFYYNYKTMMRKFVLEQIERFKTRHPDYAFYFTGHSLGGAFTTLAAFDAVNQGLVNNATTIVYTYGSPRVGDNKFQIAYDETLPETYRLVHQKDMVPHVPPCIRGTSLECLKSDFSALLWFPWHVGKQIFYQTGMILGKDKHILCEEEQSNCMNQYLLTDTNVQDHLYYFGIHINCDADTLEEAMAVETAKKEAEKKAKEEAAATKKPSKIAKAKEKVVGWFNKIF